MTGVCKFCGQHMMVEAADQEYADKIATDECKCQEGREYRNIEEMKVEAKAYAENLFKIDLPFPEEEEERKNLMLLDLMDLIIENLAAGSIKSCSLGLNSRVTAKMKATSSGLEIKKKYNEESTLTANKY